MSTLVIVDVTGKVVFTKENATETEFNTQVVEIPEGKYIKEFQVIDGVYTPVFTDIPPSETKVLSDEVVRLNNGLLEIYEVLLLGGI